MRTLRRWSIQQQLILLASLSTLTLATNSINLSQFQQINGFSADCTKAYNTPIPGCTANDFINSNPCSQACVVGLQELSSLINSACAGTSTSPNTLIGMFFQGKGVQALCPTVVSPIASTSIAKPTSAAPVATNTAPAPAPESSSDPPTSVSIVTTTSQENTPPQSSDAATATTTAAAAATTSASSIQSSGVAPSFTLSLPSTSTSSSSAQPSSTGTTQFGGQINPFSNSANPSSKLLHQNMATGIAAAAVMLLLW